MQVALFVDTLPTPIGVLRLVCDQLGRLRYLDWDKVPGESSAGFEPARDPFGLSTVLNRYFAGDIAAIEGVAVDLGGTPFQTAVWSELRRIPAGTTISYGELAQRIGNPKAVRAVGLANGSNPVSVVVPCHRVIGSNGKLTGYGGGLPRKRWLLDHEARWASPLFRECGDTLPV